MGPGHRLCFLADKGVIVDDDLKLFEFAETAQAAWKLFESSTNCNAGLGPWVLELKSHKVVDSES